MLYNIAAMYSAIGAQGRRSDADGIKASIAAFQVGSSFAWRTEVELNDWRQNAAGTLAHLLTLLPLLQPEPSGPDPPSPDLTRKSIEALRDVCLAQAQEAFWQKAVMGWCSSGAPGPALNPLCRWTEERDDCEAGCEGLRVLRRCCSFRNRRKRRERSLAALQLSSSA